MTEWIASLGSAYSKYVETFKAKGVTGYVLVFSALKEESKLEKLGVNESVHREMIIRSIKQWKERDPNVFDCYKSKKGESEDVIIVV